MYCNCAFLPLHFFHLVLLHATCLGISRSIRSFSLSHTTCTYYNNIHAYVDIYTSFTYTRFLFFLIRVSMIWFFIINYDLRRKYVRFLSLLCQDQKGRKGLDDDDNRLRIYACDDEICCLHPGDLCDPFHGFKVGSHSGR